MNSPKSLQQAINNLDSLPAIPSIALKILALKITTDEGECELFRLIEKDPPILSKIIGLSNSSMFGTGRKIITLHDAAVQQFLAERHGRGSAWQQTCEDGRPQFCHDVIHDQEISRSPGYRQIVET